MTTSIFPYPCKDIEQHIFNYLDVQSLLALSRVNQAGNGTLTNDFFKKLFEKEHPKIVELNKNVFSRLSSSHSPNGWKVACSSLYCGTFKVNKDFLLRATGCIFESIQLKKKQIEIINIEICGNGFADPTSTIDQIWKAYQASYTQLMTLQGQLNDEELAQLSAKTEELRLKYETLDSKRIENDNTLRDVYCSLTVYDPTSPKFNETNFLYEHQNHLESEFKIISSVEMSLLSLPKIEECMKLLRAEFLSHDLINRIRELINALPNNEGSWVWYELYVNCAPDTQDARWAENHFSKHLFDLYEILETKRIRHAATIEAFKKFSEFDYEIPLYVPPTDHYIVVSLPKER